MSTNHISEITKKYLDKTGLSQRKFAARLVEGFYYELSHSAVNYWRSGHSIPQTDLLCYVLVSYKDWRFDFALESLGAKFPEVWGLDNGGIWKVARSLDHTNQN